MEYIVERDLFMTKLENFLKEKASQGYKLETIFVSQFDNAEKEGSKRASKVTVIMFRE